MKITIESSVASLGSYANPHNLQAMGWTLRQIEAAVKRGTLRWLRDGNLEVISPVSLNLASGVSYARKRLWRKKTYIAPNVDPTGVYGAPILRESSDEFTAHNLTEEDLALALQLGFDRRAVERALSVVRGTSDDWEPLEAVAEGLEEHRLRTQR